MLGLTSQDYKNLNTIYLLLQVMVTPCHLLDGMCLAALIQKWVCIRQISDTGTHSIPPDKFPKSIQYIFSFYKYFLPTLL